MRLWILPLAVLLSAVPLEGQDRKPGICEVKWKYEKAILKISGVIDVSVGGATDDLRLIVRVENNEAKQTVNLLLGETLSGYKIFVLVSASGGNKPDSRGPGTTVAMPREEVKCNGLCPVHCRRGAGQTAAERRKEPEPTWTNPLTKDPMTECDIIRQYSGQPRRKNIKTANSEPIVCKQMIGWTTDPNRIKWATDNGFPTWKSLEMGSIVTCYTYIKHRADCPFEFKKIMDDIMKLTPK